MSLYKDYIRKYLGWRNWAVLYYNSIFENLFVFFYIGISTENYSNNFILNILLFLIFSLFSSTYGYLINDMADRDLDKKHGKQNTFSEDSNLRSWSVVFITLILSVFFAIPFLQYNLFIILWGTWLFLATFYSLKPIRFKEWGKAGLIIVVIAQRVLPVLIAFSAFDFKVLPDLIFITLYLFFRGITSDMNHQIQDYENDIRTNTRT
ncbi:MAG TPA: hypothetical protein ENO27_03350, partial [Caldithrix sp.]|nr:hypothetical protein [Caldithrix sp.]